MERERRVNLPVHRQWAEVEERAVGVRTQDAYEAQSAPRTFATMHDENVAT